MSVLGRASPTDHCECAHANIKAEEEKENSSASTLSTSLTGAAVAAAIVAYL